MKERATEAPPTDDRVRLSGAAATGYLMNVMAASRGGGGVNAARLASDAIAAQRGDRRALKRLFEPFRPRAL
jgi:hypothetical protein